MKVSRRRFFQSAAVTAAGAAVGRAAPAPLTNTGGRAGPLAQEHVKVFHNPDPQRYVEGCGLVALNEKTFVAVVPVVPRNEWSEARRSTESRAHIVRSNDRGQTWREVSVLPYYSAVPWVHRGRLHLFANRGGTKVRNDDLLLLRSDDGGATWSEPVNLFQGHYWNCHTGIVMRDNRLYAATDDLSLGAKRGPIVFSGDLSRDVMDPASWRRSEPVPFPGVPDMLTHERFKASPSQYLEPNVIEAQGRLRVLACVKPKRQTTAGLAAVFDVSDDGHKLDLSFVQYHPMPGGQLKFCVIRDDVSRMFWATANLVVDDQGAFDWWGPAKRGKFWGHSDTGGNDRRFLMLFYGLDGLNWFQAGCVAQAPKISQSFMYAKPVIDGDDLAIISRSSINAPNQHDADYATFHRVKNFRSLALNLYPEPETA